MKPSLSCALGLFVLAGANACAPTDAKAPGISLGAPNVPWKLKNREQRMGFMAARFEPTMKQLFVRHDAQFAAEFGCPTCHGADRELSDYHMPSGSLYELPKANPVAEAMEYDAGFARFMVDQVVPAAARLLGLQNQEVTCFTCHPAGVAD